MSNKEYYGWISVKEKMPPETMNVLIAYKEDDCDVEYLISDYREVKLGGNISIGKQWRLPQYYLSKYVKAWRAIPVFEF